MASSTTKRVLVLAGVYPPAGGGGALRMVSLLRYLPRHGWEPHVVAPRGSGGWFADPALLDRVAGIEVTRVGMERTLTAERLRRRIKDPSHRLPAWVSRAAGLARDVRNALAIPDEHLLWALAAMGHCEWLLRRRRFDLLFTASFPYSCHLAGWLLTQKRPLPWIADFADPWAYHPFRNVGWLGGAGPRGWIEARLERAVAKGAQALTVASPGMVTSFQSAHPNTPVHLLRNSFDPVLFRGPIGVRRHNRFELVFVGTFDANMSPPGPLVEGVERLLAVRPQAADELRVRVFGGADLASSEMIRRRLGAEGQRVFSFEGYASHTRAVRAMREADALFISVAAGRPWHLTAKVYEYLASGRPILAVVPPGDCRDLLAECGGAVCVHPEDPAQRVSEILGAALQSGELDTPPRNRAAIDSLAAPVIAQGAAELFDGVIGRAALAPRRRYSSA